MKTLQAIEASICVLIGGIFGFFIFAPWDTPLTSTARWSMYGTWSAAGVAILLAWWATTYKNRQRRRERAVAVSVNVRMILEEYDAIRQQIEAFQGLLSQGRRDEIGKSMITSSARHQALLKQCSGDPVLIKLAPLQNTADAAASICRRLSSIFPQAGFEGQRELREEIFDLAVRLEKQKERLADKHRELWWELVQPYLTDHT